MLWREFVVGLVSVAAVVGALKVIFGWAPVRWTIRRMIRQPAEEAVIAVVQPQLDRILHEVTFNGGGSLKDMVLELKADVAVIAQHQKIAAATFDTFTHKAEE